MLANEIHNKPEYHKDSAAHILHAECLLGTTEDGKADTGEQQQFMLKTADIHIKIAMALIQLSQLTPDQQKVKVS